MKRRKMLLVALMAIALLAYLLMNHLMVGIVVGDFLERGLHKSLVYVAWIACGFGVFIAVVLTARLPGFIALLVVACISVATNYVYAVVVKQDITPDLMEWMIHETHQLGNAWAEFSPEILLAVAKTVVLLAVFVLVRVTVRRYELLPSEFLSSVRTRAAALAAFLIFHGIALLLQPSYTVAETNLFAFGVPAYFTTVPQRASVSTGPSSAPRAEKIVFVVDESVGHTVYSKLVAPALRELPAFDFGEAAAVAACSATVNALLRWGVEIPRVHQAGYDPRTNPTIWAYAKAAGFRTTLIDGQSRGASQNFLSSGELSLVDEFIPAEAGIDSDHRIAAMLTERLARPGRELIYIVKRGSHWTYEQNYPKDTVPADAPRHVKYEAAVAYSTASFFRLLEGHLPLQSLLLVYTSDHGQNLASRAVHCSGQNHPAEYSVPLVVVTGIPALKAALAAALPAMRDHASHLNIYPTLLYGLGYSNETIESAYGPTLAGRAAAYVWVHDWLPHPTRRKGAVSFETTPYFPGRGANANKNGSQGSVPK